MSRMCQLMYRELHFISKCVNMAMYIVVAMVYTCSVPVVMVYTCSVPVAMVYTCSVPVVMV